MRIVAIVVVALLAGCATSATLYPRGGGEVAHGTITLGGSYFMVVTLKGDIYTGSSVDRSGGAGMIFVPGGTPALVATGGSSFASTLVSGTKVIRCEWSVGFTKGNGVCQDSGGITYDLVIGE